MELLGDLRALVPRPWSEIFLVATSFVCGALVGIERERQDKPAGLRTLILICLGSTIFTIASMSPVLGPLEPSRIAAQIVTGVGFLGAGSILRERHGIKGLTTAACIWATAAVGIVVGAGYAVAGLALALSILFTLAGISRVEEWLTGQCDHRRLLLIYRTERGKTRMRIQQILDEARGPQVHEPERDRGDGTAELVLEYCAAHRDHRSTLALLADLPGVEGFTEADRPGGGS
jgi:putative Mg2+ transporter-C (MgtC) family protein